MDSKINLVTSIPKPVQKTEEKPVETKVSVQPIPDEKSFWDKNKTAVIAIGAVALAGITYAVAHKSGAGEIKDNIVKSFKELYQEAVKGKKESFVNPKTGRTHAFEYSKDGKLVKETIKKGDEFIGEYAVFGDVSKPVKLKRGNVVYEYEYASMADGTAIKPSSKKITFLEDVRNKDGEIIHPKDSQAVTYFNKKGKPDKYESVVKKEHNSEMCYEVCKTDAVINANGKAEPGLVNYKGHFRNKNMTDALDESFFDSNGKLEKLITYTDTANGKSIAKYLYANGELFPHKIVRENYTKLENVEKPVLSGKSVIVTKADGREIETEVKFVLDEKGNVTGRTIESNLSEGTLIYRF